MLSLGDKIRDAIVDKLGKPNELKAATMERAAGLLGVSKSGLYQKLNSEKIPVDFLEKIQRIIGINIESLKSDLQRVPEEEQVAGGKYKFLTIPIKNHRVVKVYIPDGYDKDDLKTIKEHVNLWEKTL